ncbi:MAG: Crp/Fnr family transcriptional regulator [Oscillospiraceae bacterium]|nr:Crp/Fnr family transcriptional regulator [Oscillospiraceae bacterium]
MILYDRGFPFWEALTVLQQAEILDYTIIRQYDAGERLGYNPGVYLVNDGRIAAYSIHENGKRRMVLSAGTLETMLLTPSFLSNCRDISIELIVKENSEIYFIPYEHWRKIQEMHPSIREFSMDALSLQMSSLAFTLYARMEKDISKRLSMFLLRSCERFGDDMIYTSHEELAEQLCTTREAITRNISVLKDCGLVETGRNKIRVVNPEALKQYINTSDC